MDIAGIRRAPSPTLDPSLYLMTRLGLIACADRTQWFERRMARALWPRVRMILICFHFCYLQLKALFFSLRFQYNSLFLSSHLYHFHQSKHLILISTIHHHLTHNILTSYLTLHYSPHHIHHIVTPQVFN
jgi:hypothetical protein